MRNESIVGPRPFDVRDGLSAAGVATDVVIYREGEAIYFQGDIADNVVCILSGAVTLTVTNRAGRQAVVARLGVGGVCGEGGLAGQPVRVATATAVLPTTALVVGTEAMSRTLCADRALASGFLAHMLSRKLQGEEHLEGQPFDPCETRLARALLVLAGYGVPGESAHRVSGITSSSLAATIGTTRASVSATLRKFARLGFLSRGPAATVIHRSLLEGVLGDDAHPPAEVSGHEVRSPHVPAVDDKILPQSRPSLADQPSSPSGRITTR
jgi:CRP/FNR family transcriptional regulator, cyclic AMP receptor protein